MMHRTPRRDSDFSCIQRKEGNKEGKKEGEEREKGRGGGRMGRREEEEGRRPIAQTSQDL